MDALARAGLTRVSIGVQDFDPEVQKAINRIQSFEETKARGGRVPGARRRLAQHRRALRPAVPDRGAAD
jgi:radical SAM superfamily enzyme YgiQ (UPF0313 family)